MKVEFLHDIHWGMHCNIWMFPSCQLAGGGGLKLGVGTPEKNDNLLLLIMTIFSLLFIVSNYHFRKIFGTLASSIMPKRTGLN